MNLDTKHTIALSLFGSAIALALISYGYTQNGTYADLGSSAIWSGAVFGGLITFSFFNWFVLRALTGIRLFGFLSRDKENRKPARNFSWLLLFVTPLLLAGPLALMVTQSALIISLVAAGTLAILIFFMLLVPPSDGTRALKQFKALTDSEK